MMKFIGTLGATRLLMLAGVLVVAAGCSSRDDELSSFIATTKTEAGGRVEPLPEVKPADAFVYVATGRRSPFMPGGSGTSSAGNAPRPVNNRNREFLEQYPLDSLKMVGTIKLAGSTYGLLRVTDGRVQRVSVGNYIGQNDGKVTAVAPSRISVIEIVPDGLGGYMERAAAIALSE
jgi:type IV pilus assembly protein PilP